MTPVAVVIFVPVPLHPDQDLCSDHCRQRRYHVAAVTSNPRAAARMYADGRAEKVVVARPEHRALLADDVEVVTEWVQRHLPRQRRTGRQSRQFRRPGVSET